MPKFKRNFFLIYIALLFLASTDFVIYGIFVPNQEPNLGPWAVRAWTGLPGNFLDLFSKSYSEVVIPSVLKGL